MNETYKVQVQDLVDDLKAVFTHAGLGGEAGEYQTPHPVFSLQIFK